eukprot:CAMPEP_0175550498 /NCGR_PEP_ID=MMETSP0096-20121207/31854_1 /TAXON_ID=311494 /ORGANISM="Alexandrium monilatum, Strain CCMP3105" /LENGTH=734 /DNA_ID=CAMNT_0016853545 /DNA_START=24 /DNA_END=2225 /DNA_ORIENTATION=-
MPSPPDLGEAPSHARALCRGEFGDVAAVAALEIARQGLVREHERVLAFREAGLRKEIECLHKELSALRADQQKDLDRVIKSIEDDQLTEGPVQGTSEGDSRAPYISATLPSRPIWLSPLDARCYSVEEAAPTPGWLAGGREEVFVQVAKRAPEQAPGADSQDTRASPAETLNGSKRQAVPSRFESRSPFTPPSEQDSEGKLDNWSGGLDSNGPDQQGILDGTQDSAGARSGSRLRFSLRSYVSGVSGNSACDNQVSWRRTVNTVIVKAGMEYFDNGQSSSLAEAGPIARLRQDRGFQIHTLETIIGFVIVLNCVTLGMSSELDPGWYGWTVIDSIFAGVFTVELVMKVCLLGCRGYVWGAEWRWNTFELVLVVLAWVEVASFLSQRAEVHGAAVLEVLADTDAATHAPGEAAADPAAAGILRPPHDGQRRIRELEDAPLLCGADFIPLYCVSLIFLETLGPYASRGHGADKFAHLDQAFFTMFLCTVSSECVSEEGKPIFVLITNEFGWIFGMIYCLVQFLMTFGLFNVIVAIYVENTVSAAKFNDLHVKRLRLKDREYFAQKAQELLKLIWHFHCEARAIAGDDVESFSEEEANKIKMTQEFFEGLCQDKNFTDLLRDLDVSEEDQLDLFETLDVEGRGTIDLMNLIIGIGKLRGEARKADIISVGLLVRSIQLKLSQLDSRIAPLEAKRKSAKAVSWAASNSGMENGLVTCRNSSRGVAASNSGEERRGSRA